MTLKFWSKEWFAFIISILILTDLAILLNIPFLRQIFGFLFLTILPGLLVIQILKFEKLSIVETILYSVGLSIALLMFGGLLINTLYPLFGISKPISLLPLLSTINITIVILCILGYRINNDFSAPISIPIKEILSPPALLLYLLPFLSILGAYLVSFHHNNILLMFMIIVIALIVVLVAFDKFIPKKLYPLAVFVIAISLLYHRSLISPYLFGTDIYLEYHIYKLVELSSHWDPSAYIISLNAMLSITVLPAIYSSLLNMDGTWIFKIVYPLLFSLVPLGLYRVFQKQTDEKIAFLSTFFFMSLYVFFITMQFLMRQMIAEFFLVLLILLMVDKEMKTINRAMLTIIFGASLVVSHYGISYIYMLLFLPFIWLSSFHIKGIKKANVRGTFVAFYFVFALCWYMYSVRSVSLEAGVTALTNIATSTGDMFVPLTSEPTIVMNIQGGSASFLHFLGRLFFNVTELFIIVGVFRMILSRKEMDWDREYIPAVIVAFLLLFACLIIPEVASMLNMNRTYHLLLIFLSPCCIIGGITIFEMVSKLFGSISLNRTFYMRILVLTILIPYFLFNTGFVYEIAGDEEPTSVPLSMERMKKNEDLDVGVSYYSGNIQEQSVFGIRWLSQSRVINDEKAIYCTSRTRPMAMGYGMISWWTLSVFDPLREIRKKDAYVYLRYLNVVKGVGKAPYLFNITEVSPPLEERNKIYDNGGSEVYGEHREL